MKERSLRRITETLESGEIPIWRHPEWAERFPWLVQGTTGRDGRDDETGFGLFGATPVGVSLDRWRRLRAATSLPTAVHSRQVHGARVDEWRTALPAGLVITEGADAHVTRCAGILLTISVADCVPVFLVAGEVRAVAVAHAGWRGVAGGAVDEALGALVGLGASVEEILVHCGPAICGECYEVGPEVHQAVCPGSGPAVKAPIDLRAAIADRVFRAGVREERFTVSTHCTLCGSGFFSHRGGSAGRQLGILGIRR